MRRNRWCGIVCAALILPSGTAALAQDSLDALQQELNDAKQQHQDVTSQVLSNFFGQVDPAMDSPDAAVALYQLAGGSMPDPSPVITQNEDESASERQARLDRDQANTTRLGTALQLQCGLLHYGALFVTKPNQPGLQAQWVTWLKSAAQLYPQLSVPALPPPPPPKKKKKDRNDDAPEVKAPPAPPPPFDPSDVMSKALRDTLISKYLTFNAWGDKEQGGWTVKDLPKLYRSNVLEPLRASPNADTLAAWDAFIAMANADEKDNDKWNQVDYPPLEFDRACDDYAIAPSTEKLEGLVNLIKATQTNPQADEWYTRVGQMLNDYRAKHGGGGSVTQSTAPNPSAPASDPNVTVTQQGDATIITTHTNSASPAPPAPH
jgi:hypothetical protein